MMLGVWGMSDLFAIARGRYLIEDTEGKSRLVENEDEAEDDENFIGKEQDEDIPDAASLQR